MSRLLLDMGLARRAASDLRAAGLDVIHASELGLATTPDEKILDLAAREGFAVVTLDSDFARVAALGARTRPSILHLRLSRLGRRAAVLLLLELLPKLETDLDRGCIASVTRGGVRVKTLPILR